MFIVVMIVVTETSEKICNLLKQSKMICSLLTRSSLCLF